MNAAEVIRKNFNMPRFQMRQVWRFAKPRERRMDEHQRRLEILHFHKRWADRYFLAWLVLIVSLFTGVHFLLDYLAVPLEARTGGYVLLANIMLAGIIWQAAGMVVARIHMLIRNIEFFLARCFCHVWISNV